MTVTDTVSTNRNPGRVALCTIVDPGRVVIVPDTIMVLAGRITVVKIIAPGSVVGMTCRSVVVTLGRVLLWIIVDPGNVVTDPDMVIVCPGLVVVVTMIDPERVVGIVSIVVNMEPGRFRFE